MEREEHHIRHWDKAAADYCSRPRPGRVEYEPVVDELLGDVSGKCVLDAGCDDGTYSRKLASLGAIVTGIDGSVEMISIAEGYPARPDLGFKNGFCVDVLKEPISEPVPSEEVLRERPSWGYRMQVPSFVVVRAIRKY